MDQPRAESACDSCGMVDAEPRHHLAVPDPLAVPVADPAQVQPTWTVISKHFACCAGDGCPDGSCDAILGRVA
jgi:hypothetical protein